jgi:cold shock CspA family protein
VPVLAADFSCLGNAAKIISLIQFSTGATGVATGTVKWLDSTKGCGLLQPDSGGKRTFIHISSVELGSSLTEAVKVG